MVRSKAPTTPLEEDMVRLVVNVEPVVVPELEFGFSQDIDSMIINPD